MTLNRKDLFPVMAIGFALVMFFTLLAFNGCHNPIFEPTTGDDVTARAVYGSPDPTNGNNVKVQLILSGTPKMNGNYILKMNAQGNTLAGYWYNNATPPGTMTTASAPASPATFDITMALTTSTVVSNVQIFYWFSAFSNTKPTWTITLPSGEVIEGVVIPDGVVVPWGS